MMSTKLGEAGPEVAALGLGCVGMSGTYGEADEAESIATIHAALAAGINVLDTGDFYGMGHNEMLIGRALQDFDRDQVLISVKFGAERGPDGTWRTPRFQGDNLRATSSWSTPCARSPP